MTLLKLKFIMAATKDLNDGVNFFEGRTNEIHLMRQSGTSVHMHFEII